MTAVLVPFCVWKRGRAELLGGSRAAVLAQAEQVDAEGGQLGAIDLGDAHLQLHLRQMTGIDDQRVDDILGIDSRQPGGFIGRSIAVDDAGEMDPALLRLDFHVIAGQRLGQRIAQPGNIDIGQHGVEPGPGRSSLHNTRLLVPAVLAVITTSSGLAAMRIQHQQDC